jgi:hypothetical protein
MANFDINAAKAAGYSDAEIQEFVQQQGQQSAGPQWQQGRLQQGGAYAADQSTPEWQAKWGPLSGMSEGEQALAGAGRGIVHTGRSIGNWAGLVPDSTLTEEQRLDAPLLASPSGRFGNLVGEAAATAPLGMGAGAALERFAPALARSVLAQGAGQGAIQGAATSDPDERLRNALFGALTGGGLGAAGKVTRGAVYGAHRTPAAQTLLDQGVSLTPGQMNPGGTMNLLEQSAESLPIVKPLIHGARDSAEQDWQRAVFERAAVPGTKITPSENPSEMLQQAYDSYDPLYAQAKDIPVKPAVMSGNTGTKLSYLFGQAAQAPGTTGVAQRAAKSWLDNELTRLPQNATSTDLLTLRSNIRAAGRKAKLATDTISQDKATIFDQADQHVTSALESQLPPDALTALRNADSQYGTYKVVENAVAASKDNVAGLTPQKLSQAIYNATADPAYARGAGGPLRDLAQAGTQVFQTVVPPTGARVATLGGVALGAMTHPYVAIPAATGLLGASATRTGRDLAAGLTRPQQGLQRLAAAPASRIPTPVQNVGGQLATRGAQGALTPYTQQAAPGALAAALMLLKPENQQGSR